MIISHLTNISYLVKVLRKLTVSGSTYYESWLHKLVTSLGIRWAVTWFWENDRETLSATELVMDTNTEWLLTWNLSGFLCVFGGQGFGTGTQDLRHARFGHILNYNVRIKSGHDQWVIKVNKGADVPGTPGRVQALSAVVWHVPQNSMQSLRGQILPVGIALECGSTLV